jgi:hypothetical protein
LAEKTNKKAPNYDEEKPKRFARKRSDREKSFDSKRSKEDSVGSQYIKHGGDSALLKISRIHDEASLFIEKLNSSMVF